MTPKFFFYFLVTLLWKRVPFIETEYKHFFKSKAIDDPFLPKHEHYQVWQRLI